MINITYFMLGFYISLLGLGIFFGPLRKERENGQFENSEVTLLLMAISSLVSTYFTIERYLQALHYIQYPPQDWIEDPPTILFEFYSTLTFIPLVVTTITLLLVYVLQKRAMQADANDTNRILRNILVLEVVFWVLSASIITNLDPYWMRTIPIMLAYFILGTGVSYIMTRSSRMMPELD